MKRLYILVFLLTLSGFLLQSYGQWQPYIVDPSIDRPSHVDVGDLDGDGDPDAAATSWGGGNVFWYRNNSPGPTWTEILIDSNVPSIVSLEIIDINDDDNLDIVVAAGGSTDAVIWYENDGGSSEINWTEHYIHPDFDGGNDVCVEDVDGDGDMDVVVTGYTSNRVVWFENLDGIGTTWDEHTIDPYLGGASHCKVVYIDSDNYKDVIATGIDADSVVWYKNNGGTPITWTKNIIDPDLPMPYGIDAGDMDNDSDLDVVAPGYDADAVYWYENPNWQKRIIDGAIDGAWSVAIADMDDDSDLDVLVTGRHDNDILWYENPTWDKNYIDSDLVEANYVVPYDMDDDGDLDVILTAWDPTNKVIWYENTRLGRNVINVPGDANTIQAGIDSAANGDIVLVAPGTYMENINFIGKNITVGSWFTNTGDTSYISQTVIDGNQNYSVVCFENGEDSSAALIGFTITNGRDNKGGGIIIDYSSPTISNMIISENEVFAGISVDGFGGGIFMRNSSSVLKNVIIKNNYVKGFGGGIYCQDSDLQLNNVVITGNEAEWGAGGGICCSGSTLSLMNITISDNGSTEGGGGITFHECSNATLTNAIINSNGTGGLGGGGINCYNSNLNMNNVKIDENTAPHGGGIAFVRFEGFDDSSTVTMLNVTINDNSAVFGNGRGFGGGIYTGWHTRIEFDNVNRCNIYNNSADSSGNDLYSETDTIIHVVVDTFTVLIPDSTHAYPLNKFTFNILNPTSISEGSNLPIEFAINQNYPNPFNPSTKIKYSIPHSSKVVIKVFDILGREIETLVNEEKPAGNYELTWYVKGLSSGVYFYRIQAGSFVETKKMILMK